MLNASIYATIITGRPVAIAKIKGRNNPDGLATDIGINMPKYKTPLYGQNARAKIIPNNKALQLLPTLLLFTRFSERIDVPGILIFMRSSMKIPIKINNGPKIRSP